MFTHLPSLKSLRAFESAARHCSFAAAANELAVSSGAISYQIKQLEDSLSTSLFHRRIRQVELTAAGEKLFQTAHKLFQELDVTIAHIAPVQKKSTLNVSVSTYFVTRWLSSRLANFLNANSDLKVCLQHSVNDPDFAMNNTDIAIRWGNGNWPDCRSEPLIMLPMIALCSPTILQGKHPLESVSDLQHYPLLRDQISTDYWDEWLQLAGAALLSPNAAVIVDPNVRVQAAIDAQGVILANPLLQATIDSGLLCEPFNIRLNGYGYYIVCSDSVSEHPKYRLFRDWLMHEFMQMENNVVS